jgi:hypothetical protein
MAKAEKKAIFFMPVPSPAAAPRSLGAAIWGRFKGNRTKQSRRMRHPADQNSVPSSDICAVRREAPPRTCGRSRPIKSRCTLDRQVRVHRHNHRSLAVSQGGSAVAAGLWKSLPAPALSGISARPVRHRHNRGCPSGPVVDLSHYRLWRISPLHCLERRSGRQIIIVTIMPAPRRSVSRLPRDGRAGCADPAPGTAVTPLTTSAGVTAHWRTNGF